MKKFIIFILLLTSCSQSYQFSKLIIDCTNQVNLQGVKSATQDTPYSQCIINECQNSFSFYDLQSFINDYDFLCNQNSSNCWLQNEADIKNFSSKYPKICVPSSITCTSESVANGTQSWIGLKAGALPLLNSNTQLTSANIQDIISNGYDICIPVDSSGCSSNYTYYTVSGTAGCALTTVDCTNSIISSGALGVKSASLNFDPITDSYPTSSCKITECQPGYTLDLINNLCNLN
jgi:hypothetical protein